jgi:signal transduction histidine kinase
MCIRDRGNFADVVRIPPPDLKPINLIDCVEHAILIAKNHVGNKNVDILFNPDQEVVNVNADNGQLEQAFINVLKNSIESINTQGVIEIILEPEPLCIRICDNGKGISPEDKDKLFTPFYTNKPQGQGIGLTLTRDILTNHKCQFSLGTSKGITEFRIQFNQ